jgi:hypothetical protein
MAEDRLKNFGIYKLAYKLIGYRQIREAMRKG